MAVLKKAHVSGKGIVGMKIFGEGQMNDEHREKSLRYAIGSNVVDCMTIGMDTTAQIDQNVNLIMKIVKG
jgi:predicted aldo/keto reductase-like oxidoreductase